MNPTGIKAAATLAACLLATGAFAQDQDAPPQPIPNSIKYQDSKPNAKGSGQLGVVETRALLSRDGTATLEVTTGNLDTGQASTTANVTKVQLQLHDSTTNFNHLDGGGTFVLPLEGVERYTPFEAHVNVKNLNGGHTEVVKVSDVVRRRPDLDITAVDAPGAVRLNQPFTIVAEIRELNGDTGARTTCMLENQNGDVVDRAEGIWVDAGDSVQCLFSQTLQTLGKHVFYVKLGNTQPADWNSMFELKGLTVLATTDRQWELNASQRTIHRTYVETSSADPEHPLSGESTETNDRMLFSAVIDEPIDLATMQMSIDESTDGNLIYRYLSVPFFPLQDSDCRPSDRKHAVYHVCRFEGGLALDVVSIGSSALYVSHFWTGRYDPATGTNVYTRRSRTMTSKFGPLQRYGSSYSLRIELWDEGSHYWQVAPFVNLVPYDNPVESTTTYRQSGDLTFRTDSTFHEYGKRGIASQD